MKVHISAEEGAAANQRVLISVESLADIHLVSLNCEARRPVSGGNLTLLTEVGVNGVVDGRRLVTTSKYRAWATDDDTDDGPDGTGVKWLITASISVNWVLRDGAEVTYADAQCFAAAQGAMTCHPYARELIQNMTSRMSYPAATLDLAHSPWAGDGIELNLPDR